MLLKSKVLWFVIAMTFLLVGIFLYKSHQQKQYDIFFQKVNHSNAIVLDYTSTMGTTYIKYYYEVGGTSYNGSNPTNASTENIIPVGTTDLLIKYSIERPDLSLIVDDRYP